MATKAEQDSQSRVGSGDGAPGSIRGAAWIVSFGPVGAGSDGYLVRVETNAQALASLGYQVKVLEISRRSERTTPWTNVETFPALPSIIREQRILGPIDWLANFRGQLALLVGLIRNRRSIRSSDVVVVEGGLLFLSFALRLFRRRSFPLFVFDLITLMSSLHRDLTPLNVFVCEGPCLKLGDFGIVRQQSDGRGITARTRNALTAPSEIIAGEAPKWQARDDVYQVGQLLGMLVKGDAGVRVSTREIRGLPCSDHLKEIVYRCLGERRKRYESANELIEALRNPPAPLKAGVLRSLKGVHLAFTGVLSQRRSEAVRAAKRAGAVVHGAPSARTSVVVSMPSIPLRTAPTETISPWPGDIRLSNRTKAPSGVSQLVSVMSCVIDWPERCMSVWISPGKRRLPALAISLVLGGMILALAPLTPVRFVLPDGRRRQRHWVR